MACRKMRGRNGVRQRGATVAQQFCKLRVAGSNPVAGSIETAGQPPVLRLTARFRSPPKKASPPHAVIGNSVGIDAVGHGKISRRTQALRPETCGARRSAGAPPSVLATLLPQAARRAVQASAASGALPADVPPSSWQTSLRLRIRRARRPAGVLPAEFFLRRPPGNHCRVGASFGHFCTPVAVWRGAVCIFLGLLHASGSDPSGLDPFHGGKRNSPASLRFGNHHDFRRSETCIIAMLPPASRTEAADRATRGPEPSATGVQNSRKDALGPPRNAASVQNGEKDAHGPRAKRRTRPGGVTWFPAQSQHGDARRTFHAARLQPHPSIPLRRSADDPAPASRRPGSVVAAPGSRPGPARVHPAATRRPEPIDPATTSASSRRQSRWPTACPPPWPPGKRSSSTGARAWRRRLPQNTNR